MKKNLFIPIVLGTNREGRRSENVAKLLLEVAGKRKNVEAQLFDVRDFKLPQDGYGQDIKEQFPEWRDAVLRADGLILVVPEYNHGYPGTLKALLDVLLPEYKHKAVGLVGVSMSPWGGTRAVEAMLPVVRELGLSAISPPLNFPRVQDVFGPKGELKDTAYLERIDGFLSELEWMAQALKWGRENTLSNE